MACDRTPVTLVVTPLYYPPLVKAAEAGDIHQAEKLLREGHFVNRTTYLDQTPLHLAALAGQNEMVLWLLEREADPAMKDQFGETPADNAREQGNLDTEKIILDYMQLIKREQQAYVSGDWELLRQLFKEDGRQYTLLHIFAQTGNLPGVESEIALGADVNSQTTLDLTPLHKSVYGENVEVVKCLLSVGADINAVDFHNETPLYLAASHQQLEMIQIFLETGGDPNIRAVPGNLTALEYAEYWGLTEVANLLRNYKKSP